jgi:hypothetical protein
MMINPQEHPEAFVGVLGGLGAFIGLGKLLASDDPLSIRMVAGRCMASAGLGAAAGAATLLFPSADPVVLLGIAAGLTSISSSTLEYVIKKRLGGGGYMADDAEGPGYSNGYPRGGASRGSYGPRDDQ